MSSGIIHSSDDKRRAALQGPATTNINDLRAEYVRQAIAESKGKLDSGFVDLAYLLLEAQEKNFHILWGYNTFGDWVEHGSGLDISARQGFNLLKIAKQSEYLGFQRDHLLKVGVSKVTEIMKLCDKVSDSIMYDVMEQAVDMKLPEVRARVRELLAVEGEPIPEYLTLKLLPESKEVFDQAVELVRRQYGDTIVNGEVVEVSVSKCVELISLAYIQDPNNHPEQKAA